MTVMTCCGTEPSVNCVAGPVRRGPVRRTAVSNFGLYGDPRSVPVCVWSEQLTRLR